MIVEIILIILLVVSLGVIVVLGIRKLPQIRVVDPSSSKEAKSKELKYAILKKRLERIGSERTENLRRQLSPIAQKAQDAFRRMAGKLTALERSYAERQKGGIEKAHDPEILRQLVREAEKMMEEERYDIAEKKLIEVVSHDPKNVTAYEHLGRLYFKNKDYTAARETFSFLLRLSPRDASVNASLGEVAEAEGKASDALRYYKEALDISPHNPKYLDFYIDTAIMNGDVHESMNALEHLREVNPENQKITEFEERIEEIREKKRHG